MMTHNKYKRAGQSTTEYLILVAMMVALVIAFTEGPLKVELRRGMQIGTEGLTNLANRLSESRPAGLTNEALW